MSHSRRSILQIASVSAALGASGGRAAARPTAPAAPFIINTLGGLSNYNQMQASVGRAASFLRLDPRVVADARASGVTAMNVTFGYVSGPGDPFELTVNDIAAADETIRTNPDLLAKILSATDIEQARRHKKIGIIYGVQNCAMLGDNPQRVDLFADLGLRIFQLTYNEENALGGGSRAETKGLTPFGREVVSQVNARKAIIDVSHGGHRMAMDAVEASKQPIAITHTGCRALKDTPRNATDDLLRAVAAKGGYVGIVTGGMFLAPTGISTADDVVSHIEHAIKVCGEDAIGVGTDNPITGIDDVPAWRQLWETAAKARKAAGVGAAGETEGLPFTQDLLGPDQFRTLAQRMRARGFSQARIDKVLGLNFFRFARTVWGA